MHITPDLVLRVNEVFHDVEGAAYAAVHPEIFRGEAEGWDQIARAEIAPRPKPIRALDVGCGTGFVAQRLAPVLAAEDVVVCADLSQVMLDACRTTLSHTAYACRFEFVKLDGQSLPERDGSCDVLTMNSVLHHLPDPAAALREVGRVLKIGGAFIVAHEPNRRFYASRWMRMRARAIGALINPRQSIGAVLRHIGVMDIVHRLTQRGHHKRVLDEVNERLLTTGAIPAPLTQDELTAIVDIQSPTAGGWHSDRGIDIEAQAKRHLPSFDCRLTTYDHLGSGTDQAGRWIGGYASRIARRRPRDGATFLAILTKRPS